MASDFPVSGCYTDITCTGGMRCNGNCVGGNYPSNTNFPVKVNTNPNGQVLVTGGQTTLDKILGTALTSLALLKNASYIPTTQQPNQQPDFNAILQQQQLSLLQQQQQTNTGKFADGLQQFVSENSTMLLIGGAAYLLFVSGRKK